MIMISSTVGAASSKNQPQGDVGNDSPFEMKDENRDPTSLFPHPPWRARALCDMGVFVWRYGTLRVKYLYSTPHTMLAEVSDI